MNHCLNKLKDHEMKNILFILLSFCQISLFAQTAKTAEVKIYNGKPTLFVNNQPTSPDFYSLTHAYGAR